MRYLSCLLLFLTILLVSAPPTHAQGDTVTPQVSDSGWQARYWNNRTLTGTPVVTRQEGELSYASTLGSFAPGVNADNFSARYEKYIDVSAGTYRFQVQVDDGVRLFIDNRLVLDKWFDQASASYYTDQTLTTGYHLVVVEYYDNAGAAQMQLTWGAPGSLPTPGSWRAEYWNNKTLANAPAVSTTVADVAFDWGTAAPIAGINADGFSARFTRTVAFTPGTYRFYATADDGVRVFVAGRPVIDQWVTQPVKTFTYDIYLAGGDTEVRVEYFDEGGQAVAKVRWEAVSGGTPPTRGEAIVDDNSSGFKTGGSPTGFRTVNEGHAGRLTWTKNNRVSTANYNWASWTPALSAGRYEVFAFVPDRYSTTANATYAVTHRDGTTQIRINQSTNGGKWVSLGTYTFQGTSADYVTLTDITGERYLSRLIAFDAMKFVPR